MKHPLIIALDYDNLTQANSLVEQLDPKRHRLKVGKGMFTRFGPAFVESLVKRNFDVFLDLKFHDIPSTVADACSAAADLGVWMLNIHALGGRKMCEAARNAIDKCSQHKPLLIAVTILTSLSQDDLEAVGLCGNLDDNVRRLTRLAEDCGLDGVVCSASEAPLLRELVDKNFRLVTPGIRLEPTQKDDQKRIVTPTKALQMGVDYLVVGRPITKATDPLTVLVQIEQSIRNCSTSPTAGW